MKKRVSLKIRGRVQGVWFRASTREEAIRLGITGWVKNDFDGSVSAVAEGDEEILQAFVEWCGEGPPRARVDNIDVKWSEYTGEFENFEIKY